jgi:prepilin-type N-terminal cleavage/methylation domain-containing protein
MRVRTGRGHDGPGRAERRRGGRGFTLIELLLVIAIVATLVGLSFPAFHGVRNQGRKVQSMSNNRGLWVATMSYREDFREQLPMVFNMPGSVEVWASWFFGGKHCDPVWTGRFFGLYDFPAAQRPLNRYVMPERVFTNRASFRDPVIDEGTRRLEQAEPFRSPGDRVTYQSLAATFPTPDPTRSSYDDVGTSYHANMRMLKLTWRIMNDRWRRTGLWPPNGRAAAQRIGQEVSRRFFLAEQFSGSRLIFLHDQTADVVANDPQKRDWVGEFGELNKAVVTFIDGSTDYILVKPGEAVTPTYAFTYLMPGEEEYR